MIVKLRSYYKSFVLPLFITFYLDVKHKTKVYVHSGMYID
jgi:hypothetical protein